MNWFDAAVWMVRSLLFLTAAIPAIVYAVRCGGQPERLTAAMIALAILATTAVPRETYLELVWPLLLIDVLLLAGLTAVALCADRYWPLYFAATHLLTVALHGVRVYDPELLPTVYARLGGQLGYPTLVILIVGTWRHVRRGAEVDWSWQVDRDRSIEARGG